MRKVSKVYLRGPRKVLKGIANLLEPMPKVYGTYSEPIERWSKEDLKETRTMMVRVMSGLVMGHYSKLELLTNIIACWSPPQYIPFSHTLLAKKGMPNTLSIPFRIPF